MREGQSPLPARERVRVWVKPAVGHRRFQRHVSPTHFDRLSTCSNSLPRREGQAEDPERHKEKAPCRWSGGFLASGRSAFLRTNTSVDYFVVPGV